jgi:hypothetical protein
MVAGRADGGKHRGVSGRAILQQRDLVAEHQRAADDRLFHAQDLLVQDVDLARPALQLRQDRCTLLPREGAARIPETGLLAGMPLLQFIGVRQRGAGQHAEQREPDHHGKPEHPLQHCVQACRAE